jgi:formylglycine-generating enzyme required for sulfatase activity
MVVIPAGSFLIEDSVYGRPPHGVKIKTPFAVAKDLVTRQEYQVFVTDTGYSADRSWQSIEEK